MPSHLRAFTLTELLVVLAIIAVLGAMAVPALRGAMERADQMVCLSNLRQIGQAISEYVVDHGEYPAAEIPVVDATNRVVERKRWYHLVAPYLSTGPEAWSSGQGRVEIDPSTGVASSTVLPSQDDLDQDLLPDVFRCPLCASWPVGRNMSYGYNHQYLGDARPSGPGAEPRRHPVRPSDIDNPSRTVLVCDSAGTGTDPYRPPSRMDSAAVGNHAFTVDPPRLPLRGGVRWGSDSTLAGGSPPTLPSRPDPRHRGGCCVLYGDLSVRWTPFVELVRDDALWNGTGTPSGDASAP